MTVTDLDEIFFLNKMRHQETWITLYFRIYVMKTEHAKAKELKEKGGRDKAVCAKCSSQAHAFQQLFLSW